MVHTILPRTDLTYDDIRDTLNANGGSVTNVVETAFSPNAKINPWAKYKPVKFAKEFPVYEGFWWKAYNNKCGFKIGVLSNLDGSTKPVTKIDDIANANWYYDNVEGSYPLRMQDFAGYNPDAVPFVLTNIDKDVIDVNTYYGETYVFALDIPVPDLNNLSPSDITLDDGTLISDYYLSAAIKVNGVWREYRGGKLTASDNSVSIPVSGLDGLYDVAIYASTSSSPGLSGKMIPIPNDPMNKTSYKINVKLGLNIEIVLTHISRGLLGHEWVDIDTIPSIGDNMEGPVKGFTCNADGSAYFKGYVKRIGLGSLTFNDSELKGTSDSFDNDGEIITSGFGGRLFNEKQIVIHSITTPGTVIGDTTPIYMKWLYAETSWPYPINQINGALNIEFKDRYVGGAADFAAEVPIR